LPFPTGARRTTWLPVKTLQVTMTLKLQASHIVCNNTSKRLQGADPV